MSSFGDPHLISDVLCCDFFERRGEKRIDIGTLLAFLFFNFSDGVLCFRLIFCVVFLALVHLQVCVCAYYGHIDIFSHVIIFSILRKGSPSSP